MPQSKNVVPIVGPAGTLICCALLTYAGLPAGLLGVAALYYVITRMEQAQEAPVAPEEK